MAKRLTKAQRLALEIVYRMDGWDLVTLRANGVRRDVIDRLCDMKLAYQASEGFSFGDPRRIRVYLTRAGREAL